MKKIYIALFLSCLTLSIFANELHPQQRATLYEHMVTVNKEWNTQPELPAELLQLTIKFDSDNERIQTHLRLVSQILKDRDHNLTETALSNRKQNLESLVAYWQEGIFPINTNHNQRQPYFIDEVGTACAVGHLLQTSGEQALAQQISEEQNYAYIRELTYPQLGKWANTNGFTEDELAWIQPGYPTTDCIEYSSHPFAFSDYSSTSEIRVMKETSSFGLVVGGNFSYNYAGISDVYSLSKNNLTSPFIGFPVQIIGTVYDVIEYGAFLYVVGDFEIPGTNFKNVIRVNDTTWEGLQSGTMNGFPKHIKVYDCTIYISGNFTQVNGQPQSHLAAFSLQDMAWTTQPKACNGTQYPDILSVNGPVNDIEVHNNKLVVGGSYSQAGITSSISTPEGLSFYDNNGWSASVASNPNNPVTQVDHLVIYNNKLLVASNYIHYYDYQSWRPGDNASNSCSDRLYIQGPFDDLYAIGQGSNETVVSKIGNSTKLLIENSLYYNETTMDITIGSGHLNTGVIYLSNMYFGGNFSNGVSVSSYIACLFDCTINTISAQDKFLSLKKVKILPIELSAFNATLNEETNQVDLNWQTLSEVGVDKFIIERSIEKGNLGFESIGEVAAVGQSSSSVNYQFEDDITRIMAPNVYYRLKIIDESGAFEYSDVEVVQQKSPDRPKFRLYPNPSSGSVILNINGSEENSVNLSVYDVQGKLHHQEDVELEDYFISKQFDFNHLSQGLYIVQIKNSSAAFVLKMEIF